MQSETRTRFPVLYQILSILESSVVLRVWIICTEYLTRVSHATILCSVIMQALLPLPLLPANPWIIWGGEEPTERSGDQPTAIDRVTVSLAIGLLRSGLSG